MIWYIVVAIICAIPLGIMWLALAQIGRLVDWTIRMATLRAELDEKTEQRLRALEAAKPSPTGREE